MNRRLIVTALILVTNLNLYAQINFKEIDVFLEEQLKAWHIPNISIAITSSDSVLYIKEFGEDMSKGNYLIGSVSKPFTAIAVMQLHEQGKINLDDPVKKHLPWFETSSKKISDNMTVRHLLNQTSGLPKNAGFFTPQSSNQEEIELAYKNYLSSLKVDETALGKQHIYCNLNYQLLGQIIQKASGLSYAAYVNDFIFEPLGMKNTFASYQQTQNFGLKNGYQYLFGLPIKRTFTYTDNGIAAGDISSNAADLSKFLQVLLKNGKTANDSLVSASSLKQMHTPFSTRYGMGFSIGDWNGLHSVRHSGLTRNYSSAINILPDQNLGIVILTNINSFYAVRNLMDGIIVRLNKQEQKEYVPYELYFRYGLLGLLLWTLIEFGMRLNKWRRQQFALHYSNNRKIILSFVMSILAAFFWFFAVPYFAEIPLSKMLILQPDLGYALLIGVVVGVFSACVQYISKSNLDKEKLTTR